MNYQGFNGTDIGEDYWLYEDYPEGYQLQYPYPTPPPTSSEKFINYFYLVVFPYFLLSGTIGNILATALMRRYSHNVWSTCIYMSLIFPLDLMKLYVECGNDWLSKLHTEKYSLSHEILLLSNAVCKVYSFVYNLILSQSEWIMVAIGIETAIAFKKPSWIYTMCTRERASAIVMFISVMLITLNLHFFWTYGLIKPGEDPSINVFICTYVNELSDSFRDYIWPILNVCMEDAIPLLIVLVCIIISTPNLVPKRETIGEQNKLLEKYFLDVKALRELKVATFVTCIFASLSIICNIILKALIYGVLTLEYNTTLLTRSTVAILSYICMSQKFWIYYISCEKFRKDIKGIGRSMCRPFRRKNGKTYKKTPMLGVKSQDATASWRESETSFSKRTTGTYHVNEET